MASDHFEDVLILEPEAWLDTDEGKSNTYDEQGEPIPRPNRSGRTRVAQYNGSHGKQAIEPSFVSTCINIPPSLSTSCSRCTQEILP